MNCSGRFRDAGSILLALILVYPIELITGLIPQTDVSIVAMHLGFLLFYGGWYRRMEEPKLPMLNERPSLKLFLKLIGLAFLAYGAAMLVAGFMIGRFPEAYEYYEAGMDEAGLTGEDPSVFSLFTAVFIAPVGEEMLFRGVVLSHMIRLMPRRRNIAVWLTAILFGAFHLDLIQGSYTAAVGLVLGYAAVKYGLAASVWIHMAVNIIGTLLAV